MRAVWGHDHDPNRRRKSPDDFKAMAAAKGFADAGGLAPGVKAGQIIQWLKDDFDLGHGHAMAIVALLKGKKA